MPDIIENAIEVYMRKRAKENDILYYKFTSPMHSGVPDRILIGNNHVVFVELKRPGGTPRRLQERTINRMRAHGADVRIIDSKENADLLIHEITSDTAVKSAGKTKSRGKTKGEK